ncbi:MAG: C-terminal binding protein [candidate division NC10 bacterium]
MKKPTADAPVVFKVTDYVERDLAWEKAECKNLGLKFAAYQLKTAPAAEIVAKVKDADIVLVNMAQFKEDVITKLKRTKLIIRHGIGYDNVDVAACTKHGILFANEATASSEDVAEHALMLMLEVYRKKRVQDEMLKDWIRTGVWSSEKIHPLFRLAGKTIGIVGCGNIGSRVFKKIQGWDAKILVSDPYLSKQRWDELGIVNTPLDTLLKESDIVTIHVPVTSETRGLFSAAKFALMKPTAVIVNTARGPVIYTSDLIQALKAGKIAGAALDVFEEEPPKPKLELFKMTNVILSPHIAWYSEEGGLDIRRMIMEDVQAFLGGRLPRFVINSEVLKSADLRYPLK